MKTPGPISGQFGEFLAGALDVVFAFAVALERKGVLSRAEIAEALRQVIAQVDAQEGGPTGRVVVADVMRQAFDMPAAGEQARLRLKLLDGGRRTGED
jgi:hypothetical protein